MKPVRVIVFGAFGSGAAQPASTPESNSKKISRNFAIGNPKNLKFLYDQM
jgi:hypothetical protein